MCARFTGRRSSSELAAVGFGRRIVWSKTNSLDAPVLVAASQLDVCRDNQLNSLDCTCKDLHFADQLLHFGIIFLLDAVVIVKDLHPAHVIVELEPVTVECVLFLASGDVRDKSVKINGWLVERAPLARNTRGMFCSVARISVIIDRSLDMPRLDA